MKVSVLLLEVREEINLLLEQEGMNPLPDLFKHMVLAIFRKGARTEAWFRSSVEIAFSSLLRNGYITPTSKLNNMTLTSSGAERNRYHSSEPRAKSDLFDSTYQVVFDT